jgi:hypothetical protein
LGALSENQFDQINLRIASRIIFSLKNHYDEQFKIVFDAIRELLEPPDATSKEIGFHAKE